MKVINKFLLMIATGLFPVLIVAQSNPLDGLISVYADQPGFYFMEMKTNLFKSVNGDNNMMVVKMLTFREDSVLQKKSSDVYDQFQSSIDKEVYRGLIQFKNNGAKMDMMVKKNGNQLEEVILIIRENAETTFIAASGIFDLKDITKLREMKNCSMFDTLQILCED